MLACPAVMGDEVCFSLVVLMVLRSCHGPRNAEPGFDPALSGLQSLQEGGLHPNYNGQVNQSSMFLLARLQNTLETRLQHTAEASGLMGLPLSKPYPKS